MKVQQQSILRQNISLTSKKKLESDFHSRTYTNTLQNKRKDKEGFLKALKNYVSKKIKVTIPQL